MSETATRCPSCGKEITPAGAAFCPFCGARLTSIPAVSAEPEEAEQLLKQFSALTDPAKKQAFLKDALDRYPDSLRLNEEKLFLGRLGLQDRRRVDFSCIKCWILHLYLTPEELPEDKQAELRKELFHHPDLERCLSLAADRDAWYRHYLSRLCSEFISLFLMGSNIYNRSFFGFRLDHHAEKTFAAPVQKMMRNVQADSQIGPEDRILLYNTLWDSFRRAFGDTSYLEAGLNEENLPIPR